MLSVNGDGWLDIVIRNKATPLLQLFINQNGTFVEDAHFDAGGSSTGGMVGSLALADIDGDGDLDVLAVMVDDGGYPSVRRNQGAGRFDQHELLFPEADPCWFILLADLDGDAQAAPRSPISRRTAPLWLPRIPSRACTGR